MGKREIIMDEKLEELSPKLHSNSPMFPTLKLKQIFKKNLLWGVHVAGD